MLLNKASSSELHDTPPPPIIQRHSSKKIPTEEKEEEKKYLKLIARRCDAAGNIDMTTANPHHKSKT